MAPNPILESRPYEYSLAIGTSIYSLVTFQPIPKNPAFRQAWWKSNTSECFRLKRFPLLDLRSIKAARPQIFHQEMEVCDDDSSDESVEEIEIKPVRPVPRSRIKEKVISPTRSISPTSMLSVSGDQLLLKKCIDNYDSVKKAESFPAVIPLNVGGVKYVTRLSTLKKYPDSMLAALFSGRYQVDKDAEGNYFLDSNGMLFGYLLEYLRTGLIPPREQSVQLYREASYYGIHELVDRLQFMPQVCRVMVKEAHISQFPNYANIKEEVIRKAIENATFTKLGEVIIYAFKTEFVSKVNTFNPNHGCIIESAHLKCGPWDAPVDEEVFIKCLENDLMEDGFQVRPHEAKRKCRYYHGQSCQKFVYRIAILF